MNARKIRMAALVLAVALSGSAQADTVTLLVGNIGLSGQLDTVEFSFDDSAGPSASGQFLGTYYSNRYDFYSTALLTLNQGSFIVRERPTGCDLFNPCYIDFIAPQNAVGTSTDPWQKNNLGSFLQEYLSGLSEVPNSGLVLSFLLTPPSFNFSAQQYNGLSSNYSVSVATSVPEPETYAMMLAGLGLLGMRLRTRKATQS